MKRVLIFSLFICSVANLIVSCQRDKPARTLSGLSTADFVTETDGKTTGLYSLTNAHGMEVCITNYGGRIVSVMVPDKHGNMTDVVLGFDNIQDYIDQPTDFGATIGRYANRIAHGRFELDGKTVQLPTNNNGHTLHGGPDGWHDRVFEVVNHSAESLTLQLVSPDGDQGFPGTVTADVTFTVTPDNAIDIQYKATTDRTTVVNMTNHSYFNLSDNHLKQTTDHMLYINADIFAPIDSLFIPLGTQIEVEGTPMDFRLAKTIAPDIDTRDFEAIRFGRGFDHNWILNTKGDIRQLAAKLTSFDTGISVEVYTDEPGIQVYTGNFMDENPQTGKGGIRYDYRQGVCLETQHYPDSPNRPEWPSVVLNPGEVYRSHCIYRFTVNP